MCWPRSSSSDEDMYNRVMTHESGSASTRTLANHDNLVPSRRQYLELRSQHPEAILLYRMGDFYETFDDDARIVSRDARITLTSRSFGRSGRVPMAGIPHHALNYYLGRLLSAGHTVAIADQMSEPGRGLVERQITHVLTPGTIGEGALLPEGENLYLAAIATHARRFGLAWVDVSTGEFVTSEFPEPDAEEELWEKFSMLDPAECLISDTSAVPWRGGTKCRQTRLENWHLQPEQGKETLLRHFGVRSLDAYGCAELPGATAAAGAIIAYLRRTNRRLLPLLTNLRVESNKARVGLDAATRQNLELTRSNRTRGTRGSLLEVLNRTVTSMGARTLRKMLCSPVQDLDLLQYRQQIIGSLIECASTRARVAETLRQVGDLERLTSRITQGAAGPRDLLGLARSLEAAADLNAIIQHLRLSDSSDSCKRIRSLIRSAIEEDTGGAARIRPSYHSDLSHHVRQAHELRQWLVGYEMKQREYTGIKSLKVAHNKVFGYHIEITRSNLHLVPDHYIRKQTISTGERFITAELQQAETSLLSMEDQIERLEREAVDELTAEITKQVGRILDTARTLAELDAMLALAETATVLGWVRPELVRDQVLEITDGRHPVVEASLLEEPFIPNSCRLGGKETPRQIVVTGPNMGGKSTYLRQVAVIVLLAQIGSWVPAKSARIGVVDRIFTRVGAHDDLAGRASTFMVEMVETATILHQATERSLIVLDEVGRGTSTQDGLAIARAVLEDIAVRIRARALFATHYLELAETARSLPSVTNAHVDAVESDGKVVFLYAIRPGSASRAYGIHVARLAGLPPWVAERAQQILLSEHEVCSCSSGGSEYSRMIAEHDAQHMYEPDDPDTIANKQLADRLRELDVSKLTPRDAINWLFDQQESL